MAVTYVETDTSLLAFDVQSLNEAIEKAGKCLESLQVEMTELNSMWSGQANRAFMIRCSQDYTFIKNILSELETMTACMTHACSEYVRCENQVSELVNNISI